MDLAEQARHLRQQAALRRPGRPFPPALIAQVRDHVDARRAAGDSVQQVALDLGITFDTLYRWRREAPAPLALRPVQVVAAPQPATLTVLGPCDLRVEGLSLDQLAQLLRRLA